MSKNLQKSERGGAAVVTCIAWGIALVLHPIVYKLLFGASVNFFEFVMDLATIGIIVSFPGLILFYPIFRSIIRTGCSLAAKWLLLLATALSSVLMVFLLWALFLFGLSDALDVLRLSPPALIATALAIGIKHRSFHRFLKQANS